MPRPDDLDELSRALTTRITSTPSAINGRRTIGIKAGNTRIHARFESIVEISARLSREYDVNITLELDECDILSENTCPPFSHTPASPRRYSSPPLPPVCRRDLSPIPYSPLPIYRAPAPSPLPLPYDGPSLSQRIQEAYQPSGPCSAPVQTSYPVYEGPPAGEYLKLFGTLSFFLIAVVDVLLDRFVLGYSCLLWLLDALFTWLHQW